MRRKNPGIITSYEREEPILTGHRAIEIMFDCDMQWLSD